MFRLGIGLWLGRLRLRGGSTPPIDPGDALLIETGDYLLLESGDKLLLEA